MVHHRKTNTLYSIRNCLSGRHDSAQESTLMSANVVFNVATQLDNRCNFMECVRRYITFCNALTGHFTQMHNPCKLLSQSHKQIANKFSLFMNTMKGHREAEFVISTTPSSCNCINEYLARDGDCNMHIRE